MSVVSMPSGGVYDPTLRLSWSRRLPAGLGATGNLSVAAVSDELGRYEQKAVNLAVGRGFGPISISVGGSVYDRTQRNGRSSTVLDTGFARTIGKNVEIDVSAGRSFATVQREWFVAAGVSIQRSDLGWLAGVLRKP